MTIGGALSDLNNLLKADDIPIYYKPSIKAVMDTIKLSSLENPNKWIPVSERLPNLDDFIGEYIWQKKVLITCYLSFDHMKNLFVTEAFAKDVVYNSVHDIVVIAWMPLPKPYEPQESEG